jgi:integrase
MNKPFYHKHKNAWYLQQGKRQLRLAENRDEAFAMWHRMMSGETAKPSRKVEGLYEDFVRDMSVNVSQSTIAWYKMFLDVFVAEVGPDKDAESVVPYDVTSCMNRQSGWHQNTRHNFVRAVKRLYKWSVDQGLLASNPIANMVKPRPVVREDFITDEQFDAITQSLPEGPFKDLLVVAWDTGMRPQELFALESRHVDGCKIVFPRSESKGKISVRVVYVGTERSNGIIERLSSDRVTGKLFRNTRGVAWNKGSVKCAFARLEKATGIKTHLGAFRKGFCTTGLKNGVDTVTMSHLMGHASTAMVSRVYAKVHHDPAHMLAAATRVRAERSQGRGKPTQET